MASSRLLDAVKTEAAESSDTMERIRREPSHDEIAAFAHTYWLQRGSEGGSAEEDWLRAEAALRERASPDA